jgi:hypothetical protein
VTVGTNVADLTLVGPLSITVDGPSSSAQGTAPGGADVYVEAGGVECGSGGDTTADAAGTWSIDLSADCPGGFGSFTSGQVLVFDPEGDATQAETLPPRTIRASLTLNWVQGFGFAPDTSVDITINGDTFFGAADTDGTGTFAADPGNLGDPNLVPGDTVSVTDGVDTSHVTLVGPLSIEIDVGAATAHGTAPTSTPVRVEMGGDDCGTGGDTDSDALGEWSIDLSGNCPLGLGANAGGQVLVFDGEGDATQAEPVPPRAIFASPTDDYVAGFSFAPTTSVDITINTDTFIDAAETDHHGNFFAKSVSSPWSGR